MKRMLLIVGTTAAVTACAAMLDLAGTDRTVADVADLASYDGVTNSSATAATLTFNIADDQAYANTIGGNIAVVKAGAGTLDLGAVARTYSGGTQVNAGILKLGKHLSVVGTGAIRVANGAALDVCSPAVLASSGTATAFPAIYICGTGPDGNGALLNTQEATTNKKLPHVYLTDDLLVNSVKRLDIDVFHAQGHTLRLNTAGEQMAVATFDNASGGDISIEAGQFTAYGTNNSLGNTPSKGKVYLRGGILNLWGDKTLKNTIIVEKASTVKEGDTTGKRGNLNGPLTVNAPLKVQGNYVVINGSKLAGTAAITNVGTFANAVSDANNTYTGMIVNNGKLLYGHNNSVNGSLTRGVVTNYDGKTLYYQRKVTGTNTASTIIGGILYLDSDLDPNGHLVFRNCTVTNMQTYLRRGAISFDTGARWVSPEKDFRIGEQWAWGYTNTVGTLNIKDGCDVTVKNFSVGNATLFTYTNAVTGATYHNVVTGIVNQSGGIVRTVGPYGSNAAEYDGVRLGHYPAGHAFWNMTGGKLIVELYRLSLATDGYGTFNLSGGEVFTDEVNLNGRPAGKGYGILNVTGGELNVGTNGIRKSSTNDRYEIHLGGGTIRASAATGFTCPLAIDLTGSHGGVTFDTTNATVTLSGVLSGVGGLTKTGTGTLTLSGANTYAGATRLVDGTVAFTQAYPGGDLELGAAAQGGTSAPLLTAPSFAFAEGKGVRITEADTLDQQTFGPMKTLVSSSTPIASVPTLALVATDGTPFTDEKGIWHLYLVDGGRTLKFGPMRGTQILLK